MADLLKHLHWKLMQAPPPGNTSFIAGTRTFTEREVRPLLRLAEAVTKLEIPHSVEAAVDYLDVEDDDEISLPEALEVLRRAQAGLEGLIEDVLDLVHEIQHEWVP